MILDDDPTQDQTPPADLPADPPADGDTPADGEDSTPPADSSTPPADPTPPADDGAEPEGAVSTPPADDDTDDLTTPEDKTEISKQVKKAIAPLEDTIFKGRIETELQGILAENPEYKPFEARIRRFVTHANRAPLIKQGLPVKTVVLEALAPHLQEIGAAKSKAADDKANLAKDGGSAARPSDAGNKLPDFSTMSPQEIEKIGEQVKSHTYKPS